MAACGAEAVPSEEGSADTARVETVLSVSGFGGPHEVRSSSVVDYARDRSSYVEPTSGCAVIAIGDVSYAEVPQGAGMPAGKRWVMSRGSTTDLEAEFERSQQPQTNAEGATVSILFGFAPPDPSPAQYLAHLREHGELEQVGGEDVRGVPTTRYRTTRDPKRETRRQLEDEGWKETNIEKYLETIPETEEEVELWVDDDGLARRVVTTSTTEFPQTGVTQRAVTTSEYFDFGVESEIEAPPAAEVIESDEWQRLMDASMKEQMEEEHRRFEGGIESLPGAFEPSVAPSCLH